MKNTLDELWGSSHLSIGHSAYLEDLFEQYLSDPSKLPEEWVNIFDSLSGPANGNEISHKQVVEEFKNLPRNGSSSTKDLSYDQKQAKVVRLIQAYRNRGHLNANLDPLSMMHRPNAEDLTLEYHNLSEQDLDTDFYTDSLDIGKERATLREILNSLKKIYCGNVGIEFNHIMNRDERSWFQKIFESKLGGYELTDDEKIDLEGELAEVRRKCKQEYVNKSKSVDLVIILSIAESRLLIASNGEVLWV